MAIDLKPFYFEGGQVGCLLVHGGTGSPAEMRPMGEYLASQGLTVHGVRLAGHGTTPEDLETKTWRDLVVSAEAGLDRLQGACRAIFVIGLSLGGLIALHLAANHPVAGAVVMSAPGPMRNWRMRLLPVLRLFRRWHYSSGDQDLTDQEAGNELFFYRRVPLSFGSQFIKMQRQVFGELSQVEVPILVAQGAFDRTIPAESGQFLFDRVASKDKQLVLYPNSGHAMTVDSEREQVWEDVRNFVTTHSR